MKRSFPQVFGEVSNTQHLESKLLDLTSVLSQMVVRSGRQLMVCGICAMTEHYTDKCLTLGSEQDDVNEIRGYQGQPKPMRFQNTYKSNWRNNPNNLYPPKQMTTIKRDFPSLHIVSSKYLRFAKMIYDINFPLFRSFLIQKGGSSDKRKTEDRPKEQKPKANENKLVMNE
uniref:Uncharacterized protein n=1 Tax=Lactuca sativa TaxID=4236 RepID=A0A9R1UFV2_LACSA|nr:hypothetical protein LSAT_V11C900460710 [Lactuca sativa]